MGPCGLHDRRDRYVGKSMWFLKQLKRVMASILGRRRAASAFADCEKLLAMFVFNIFVYNR